MNEQFSQPIDQEKNISFERPDMVKEYNDLYKQWEGLNDFDKNSVLQGRGDQKNIDMYNRKNELYDTVTNIDKYKELAKPQETQEHIVGDISNSEKLQAEKQKVDMEIQSIKGSIDGTTRKLNYLRQKLGMQETDMIPSLMVKKEKLSSLVAIQNDLENKLNFENKKSEAIQQEGAQNSKIEKGSIGDVMNSISHDLKNISRILDSRVSKKESGVLNVALQAPENPDLETVKEYLSKINIKVNEMDDGWSTDDNPENMRQLSRALSKLKDNVQEISSKIKDEEQRKDFLSKTDNVVDNINKASSFFIRKAQGLEAYKNTKM